MSLSLAGSGEISGFDAGLSGFGGLVVVKSALFTGTQTNSTASGANFAVTDLSITHTLADASNKLIFMGFVGAMANTNGEGQVGILIAKDGTGFATGGSNITAGGPNLPAATNDNFSVNARSIQVVHEPGDTSSHTYTLRATNIASGTETVYINRNESGTLLGASGLILMEVKV